MPTFLTLWSGMLSSLQSFLLAEPVCYFIGAFLLLVVAGLVRKICKIN